jgi:large subunit ribosomal protein L23
MKQETIKNPRVTEKGSYALEANVYTFDVTKNATKQEIKKAIFDLYKVKPIKVNVLAVPKKRITLRGHANTRGGGRKAMVYLKEGDKIELI